MKITFNQIHTTQGDRFIAVSASGNALRTQRYHKTEKAAISWAFRNGHEVIGFDYI